MNIAGFRMGHWVLLIIIGILCHFYIMLIVILYLVIMKNKKAPRTRILFSLGSRSLAARAGSKI